MVKNQNLIQTKKKNLLPEFIRQKSSKCLLAFSVKN